MRYIDVTRLCEWLKNLKSGFAKEELVFRDELIEHLQGNNGIANVLPPVDVVEVVRCKGCVYCDGEGRCEAPENGLIRDFVKPDDFCSFGERKE